jgi:hypothetical protein
MILNVPSYEKVGFKNVVRIVLTIVWPQKYDVKCIKPILKNKKIKFVIS